VLISLGTSATLQNVEDLKRELIAAIHADEPIELDAADVQTIDLSTVQLIEAARLEVETRQRASASGDTAPDRGITLAGPANPAVHAILERAGFFPTTDAQRCRFWNRAGDSQ